MRKGILILILFSLPLFAAEQKGLIDEYKKIEQENQGDQKLTDKQKEKKLVNNLYRAMKYTLLRRITDKDEKEKLKDFKPDSIKFERKEKTFIFYVNYGDYYCRMLFKADPRIYIVEPVRIAYEKKGGSVNHPD